MNLVYLVQAAAMMLFGLVALYIRNVVPIDNVLARSLRYILIALFIGALISAQFVPAFLIARIDKKMDLENKISKYFQVVIIRGAFLEVPGLLAGIATLLTGRSYFTAVVVLLLPAFYFYRPSKERITEELNLNETERNQLDASE
ncbi:MAG TPA: hypothetical protein VFW11_22130 [Cyclobacteriaceae bacterium]|nr:hypothetical protein [Cyclobacteriaceae bacterium]